MVTRKPQEGKKKLFCEGVDRILATAGGRAQRAVKGQSWGTSFLTGMWYSFEKCLQSGYACCDHTNPDIFHLYSANTSYTFSMECSRSVYVRVSVWALTHTDKMRYLDERQRLLSAADQCSFLLLLLLNDGGKGHQGGGEGRAAHCTQHPGPEGERRVMQRERGINACAGKATRVQVRGQRLSQLLLTSSCVKCRLSTWFSQISFTITKQHWS